MAAPPILLVADDLSLIAAVKRVLAREGYECVLATNAADAVIAWGHALPGLLLLQPSVESDRGVVALEELQQHPDAKLLRVVLLGETVPGFPWPVEPLPLDARHFAQTVEEHLRSAGQPDGWTVRDIAPVEPPAEPPPAPAEPEPWRATAPPAVPADASATEVPEPRAIDDAPPTPPGPVPQVLEERLFGDIDRELEAETLRAVGPLEVAAPAPSPRPPRASPPVTLTRPPASSRSADVLARAERVLAEARAAAVDLSRREATQAEAAEELATLRAAAADTAARVAGELKAAQALMEEADRRRVEVLAEAAATQEQLTETVAALEGERRARERAEQELSALRAGLAEETGQRDSLAGELAAARALAETERRQRGELEAELGRVREQLDAAARARDVATAELDEARQQLEGEAAKAAALDEAQARAASLEAELTRARADLEELHAGDQAAARRAEELAAELEAARGHAKAETRRAAALDGALEEARAEAARAGEQLSALEARHAVELARLDARVTTAEAERDEATARAEREREARNGAAAEAAEAQRSLEEVIEARAVTIQSLEEALAAAREDADAALALASEVEAERQRLAEVRSELEVAKRLLAETRDARDGAQRELLAAEAARDEAQQQLVELGQRVEALQADLTSASELLEDTAKERDALRTKVAALEPTQALARELGESLETEVARRQAAEAALESEAEARAAQQARAEALEAREVLSIALPNHRAVGVPRHGEVDLEGVAQVVTQIVLANAEVRLELGVAGGARTLWFKRGQIVAAESSLPHEGLIARARRDGLIDARQEGELRMLAAAPPREQLEALKARAFIRDIESVPLVQRYTEQVALDAFAEPSTRYRLVEEAPQAPVLLATVPRATLPMLAEALRRAVPPDEVLARLGGGEAVATATDSELDLRALGFSERERKMLSWVDGEANVEDLSLASGLKPDAAFRALLVAKWLGLITLTAGVRRAEPVPGQLDERRLDAKYDEVQDADYFTILGLPRSAGADEVRRAYERLSQEFDPLRFSGHADASLQQRAQVVANLLEEAARALEDDRRRVEYARHLLD